MKPLWLTARASPSVVSFCPKQLSQTLVLWQGVRRDDEVWSSQTGAFEGPSKSWGDLSVHPLQTLKVPRDVAGSTNFPPWPENSDQWSWHLGTLLFCLLSFITLIVSTLSSTQFYKGVRRLWYGSCCHQLIVGTWASVSSSLKWDD